MSQIENEPPVMDATQPADSQQLAWQRAIKPIERQRHFHIEVVGRALGMILLVVIWATSEYHNAGGWPTHGFSQSSGTYDVWHFWIVYPLIAWVLFITARAWAVYGHKPISESEIEREMERQSGGPGWGRCVGRDSSRQARRCGGWALTREGAWT